MIITEQISERRQRTYSDLNLKIRQIETGNIYNDAVDMIPCRYTYEETNELIESDDILDISDSQALSIIATGN